MARIISISLLCLPLCLGCSSPAAVETVAADVPVQRIDHAIIEQAVAECENAPTWGINLAKVRVNYIAGAHIEAALILHNGDDTERYVKLSFKPTYAPTVDKETGISYETTPVQASGWVTIDADDFRMAKMQTEVIPIHLLVPTNYEVLPPTWEFDIRASGTVISQYQYTIKVTTEKNDTSLAVHLPMPPLNNDAGYILDIISTIDEAPYVTSYDSDKTMLNIGRLKDESVREITIIYEYGEPVGTDYYQRWLVTTIG